MIGTARFLPVCSFQCSTPGSQSIRRQPKSCFRENQLLQCSISFSLQPTSHPNVLNGKRVRASMCLSTHFTLLMGSSHCFGSYAYYWRAIHTRFPFGSGLSSLAIRSTHKLAGSFFNRHAVEVLPPLPLVVDIWFQIYFTPLIGVLFTFPSRY